MLILQILGLQLFWLSFTLIGGALLHFAYVKRKRKLDSLWSAITQFPLLGLFFLASCTGFITMAPAVSLSYILVGPMWPIMTCYSVLVIGALVYWYRSRGVALETLRKRLGGVAQYKYLVALVAVSLSIDFIISLIAKAPLQSDAGVHVSRINFIMEAGYTLEDPFFGNNGVVDPRYSTNLMLGLMALGAKLLHIGALEIWYYSYGFFRLITWASIFLLLWNFLDKKVQVRWSFIVLAISPFVLSYFFINAIFPDRIIIAWFALLIMGIKLMVERGKTSIVILAASLIALTHALGALMALGFCALVFFYMLLTRIVTKKTASALFVSTLLLALPVLANLHYPNLTATYAEAFSAGPISGAPFIVQSVGPLEIGRVTSITPLLVAVYAGLTVLILCLARLKNAPARAVLFILTAIPGIIMFQVAYVACLGYYQLIRHIENKHVKAILVLLILYYPLLNLNPVFVGILAEGIPPWIIARFQEFNVFWLIAMFIGLIAYIEYPFRRWKGKKLSTGLYIAAVPVYLLFIPLFYPGEPVTHAGGKRDERISEYNAIAINSIRPQIESINGQIVYTPLSYDNFYIPAIAKNKTRTITTGYVNYSPMANIAHREACGAILEKTLRLEDLRAAGATRVISDSSKGKPFARLAARKPYLMQISTHGSYTVYKVEQGKRVNTSLSGCYIPYRQ